jgi:hypothetical protein
VFGASLHDRCAVPRPVCSRQKPSATTTRKSIASCERWKLAGNWINSGPSFRRAASGSTPPLNASTSAWVTGPGSIDMLGVREFLVQLDREFEVGGCAFHPAQRRVGARLAVKRAVHLHGVEALRIEAQLVKPRSRSSGRG